MPAIGSDRRHLVGERGPEALLPRDRVPANPLPPTDGSGETRRQVMADVDAGRNPDFAGLREAMRRVDAAAEAAANEIGDIAVAEVQKEVQMAENPEKTQAQKDMLGRDRVIGLKNADGKVGINPKDRIGATKLDYTLVPSTAYSAMTLAFMDGATKYGPYNWRVEPIQIRTYLAAMMRHIQDVLESEEVAPDSLIDHLGHVMSGAGILIDAISFGTVIDDRPIPHHGAVGKANAFIKEQKPEGWGR